jgi:hypothetical protein
MAWASTGQQQHCYKSLSCGQRDVSLGRQQLFCVDHCAAESSSAVMGWLSGVQLMYANRTHSRC